jgi:hypothetical protein
MYDVIGIRMLCPSLAPLYRPQPRNYMAVHPTTVGELFRTQLDLHPTVRHHTEKLFGQMQDGIEEESGTRGYFEELDNRILMRMFAPMLETNAGRRRSSTISAWHILCIVLQR